MLAFAFWDIFSPLRSSALLALGLPLPDLDGVITFYQIKKRPGWVPSLSRGLGVFALPRRAAVPHHRKKSPVILSQHRRISRCGDCRLRDLIKGSFAFTRPFFPSPGFSFRLGDSLGFTPGFTPHRCQ